MALIRSGNPNFIGLEKDGAYFVNRLGQSLRVTQSLPGFPCIFLDTGDKIKVISKGCTSNLALSLADGMRRAITTSYDVIAKR